MKKRKYLFSCLALVLSHLMCIIVAYDYAAMRCAIAHGGASAPQSIVFFTAVPFAAGIVLCGILAYVFHRKAK